MITSYVLEMERSSIVGLIVYSTPEYVSSHDCDVTCFFIDCAHNIIIKFV